MTPRSGETGVWKGAVEIGLILKFEKFENLLILNQNFVSVKEFIFV